MGREEKEMLHKAEASWCPFDAGRGGGEAEQLEEKSLSRAESYSDGEKSHHLLASRHGGPTPVPSLS